MQTLVIKSEGLDLIELGGFSIDSKNLKVLSGSHGQIKSWVAKIPDLCETYGLKREFIKSQWLDDDQKFWDIEHHTIYQYKDLIIEDNKTKSGFFIVINFIIYELNQIDVFRLIRAIKQRSKIETMIISYQDDDLPF